MERRITVRVSPRARHARIFQRAEDEYDVAVTVPAERGRATDAARRALAQELGIAPSRISLVMGERSRTKVFRVS